MSKIYVDEITGFEGTETGAPITLSGDTVTLGTGATISSSATFPTGTITNLVTQTTTTTGIQELTDTYTAVTGSLVSSYTPTTGASSVYYSVNFIIQNLDTRGICSFIPFLDGTQQGQKKGFSHDRSTGVIDSDYVHYFTTFSTSGWTSGKDIELRARRYSNSYDVRLNVAYNFHDTGSTASEQYINVVTIVYSIM